MKKLIILSVFLMISSFTLIAQAPPNPPQNANEGGGPVGGGAPIGEGIVLLSVLAAAYGGKKVFTKPNLFKR
jgi:hypothetical protein